MSIKEKINYIITCGDEGVQLNKGKRIAVLGAGFRLEGFDQVVTHLKELFSPDIRIAGNEENEWMKRTLELDDWEQVNASSEQYIKALADQQELLYSGMLTFTDPKDLKHGIKGHMVRPHGIHIATKICFTLGGAEQIYNLGQYLISADWLHLADKKMAKKFIMTQVEFYQKLGNNNLKYVFDLTGKLGEDIAKKNQSILTEFGIK